MEVIKKLLPLLMLPFVLFGDLAAAKKDSSLQRQSKTSYGLRDVRRVDYSGMQSGIPNAGRNSSKRGQKRLRTEGPQQQVQVLYDGQDSDVDLAMSEPVPEVEQQLADSGNEQVEAGDALDSTVSSVATCEVEVQTVDEQPAQDSSTFKNEIKKRPGVEGGSKKTRPYLFSLERKKDKRTKRLTKNFLRKKLAAQKAKKHCLLNAEQAEQEKSPQKRQRVVSDDECSSSESDFGTEEIELVSSLDSEKEEPASQIDQQQVATDDDSDYEKVELVSDFEGGDIAMVAKQQNQKVEAVQPESPKKKKKKKTKEIVVDDGEGSSSNS